MSDTRHKSSASPLALLPPPVLHTYRSLAHVSRQHTTRPVAHSHAHSHLCSHAHTPTNARSCFRAALPSCVLLCIFCCCMSISPVFERLFGAGAGAHDGKARLRAALHFSGRALKPRIRHAAAVTEVLLLANRCPCAGLTSPLVASL